MRIKSSFLVIFLLLGVILINGCETTMGLVKGTAVGVSATAEGAAKDTKNLWQAILKTDRWIEEHLW